MRVVPNQDSASFKVSQQRRLLLTLWKSKVGQLVVKRSVARVGQTVRLYLVAFIVNKLTMGFKTWSRLIRIYVQRPVTLGSVSKSVIIKTCAHVRV